MNNLKNIENLLNLVTIQQMHTMLQSMNKNTPIQVDEDANGYSDSKCQNNDNLADIYAKIEELKISQNGDKATINSLLSRINVLEAELASLKATYESQTLANNTNASNSLLKGQQPLTKFYHIVKNDPIIDDEQIVLNIEETVTEETSKPVIPPLFVDDEPIVESESESDTEVEVHTDSDAETNIAINDNDNENENENDNDNDNNEDVVNAVQKEEEIVEANSDDIAEPQETSAPEIAEPQEDDEEVFEIEIDDITYFATDEENGIIYEVTADGDVGRKVGILKDGEPIFA